MFLFGFAIGMLSIILIVILFIIIHENRIISGNDNKYSKKLTEEFNQELEGLKQQYGQQ